MAPGKWAARDLGMLYHNHQQLERVRLVVQMGGGHVLACHHSILSLQAPHIQLSFKQVWDDLIQRKRCGHLGLQCAEGTNGFHPALALLLNNEENIPM